MNENQRTDFQIRMADNRDVDAIIRLIGTVLKELGDEICLDDSESELLDIETNYVAKSGGFWVIDSVANRMGSKFSESQPNESNNIVFGTHATLPDPNQPNVCTFKRLYVDSSLRGTNWSHQLMQITIDWAKEKAFERVEFWSDTRFHRAHRFFEKFDFKKSGEVRTMTDSHEPYQEFFFYLNL